MSTDTLLIIVTVIVGSLLGNFTILIFRRIKLLRSGPSQKQFTDAVEIVTLFIVQHNARHPDAKIKYIQISETGVQ